MNWVRLAPRERGYPAVKRASTHAGAETHPRPSGGSCGAGTQLFRPPQAPGSRCKPERAFAPVCSPSSRTYSPWATLPAVRIRPAQHAGRQFVLGFRLWLVLGSAASDGWLSVAPHCRRDRMALAMSLQCGFFLSRHASSRALPQYSTCCATAKPGQREWGVRSPRATAGAHATQTRGLRATGRRAAATQDRTET